MKRNLRLLLPILSILLTLACLGSPEPTTQPVSNATSLPGPSTAPTPTLMSAQFPGLKIAYILDGNIWFWDGGAPARQLTSDGDAMQVKISDDGAVITYQRGQSLWAVNADDSSPRLLVDITTYIEPILSSPVEGLDIQFRQFGFQPNSHWVYFTTKWEKGQVSLPTDDLHRVDIASQTPQMLLTKNGGLFTFSPDGTQLALSSLTQIWLFQSDGGDLISVIKFLSYSTNIDDGPQIVWLSNGTGFYTTVPFPDIQRSRYYFIPSGGGFSATLSEFQSVPYHVSQPIISPDGLKVAYVKQTATAYELHVIEASTADTIIASYEGAPLLVPWGWSPDSKRVVFSNAHPMLLLTAGIGIQPAPLTEAITPHSLRWIGAEHFIFFREGNLLIGQINNPETILIASGFSNQADTKEYDFVVGP